MTEAVAFLLGVAISYLISRFIIYGTIEKQSSKSLKRFVKMVERVLKDRGDL